jgi:hypothetical protein
MKRLFTVITLIYLWVLPAAAQELAPLQGELALGPGESVTTDVPGVRDDLGVFPPFVVVSKTMMDEATAAAVAELGADAAREALAELAESLIPDLNVLREVHPEAELLIYDGAYWLTDNIVLVPTAIGEAVDWDPLLIPEVAKRIDPQTYVTGDIEVVAWQYPVPPDGPVRIIGGRILPCNAGHCEDLRQPAEVPGDDV